MMPLRNEMKCPDEFTSIFGVLNFGYLLVTVIYIIFGFFGYWKYGDDVDPTVTLNFPPTHLLPILIQALLVVSTLSATPLAYYITFHTIWKNWIKMPGEQVTSTAEMQDYMVRAFIITLSGIFALAMPALDIVMSLAGLVTMTTLGTAIPCIAHRLTMSSKVRKDNVGFFLADWTIIFLSLTLLVFGVIDNYFQIIELYADDSCGS